MGDNSLVIMDGHVRPVNKLSPICDQKDGGQQFGDNGWARQTLDQNVSSVLFVNRRNGGQNVLSSFNRSN